MVVVEPAAAGVTVVIAMFVPPATKDTLACKFIWLKTICIINIRNFPIKSQTACIQHLQLVS
jgi:hypothetical protein